MAKIFLFLYNFFKKHRVIFVLLIAASFLFVGYYASKIRLEEDISKFIPQNQKTEKFNFVYRNLKLSDKLMVNIYFADSNAKPDPERLIAISNDLVASLTKEFKNEYIKEITHQIVDDDLYGVYDSFYQYLPVFLDSTDYPKIDSIISEKNLQKRIEGNYKTLISPTSIVLKKFISRDPLGLTSLALNKLKGLQVDNNFDVIDGHIFSKNHQNLLLFIIPANPVNETSKNGKLLKGLDKVIDSLTLASDKKINIEYYGAVAVSVGNANQLKKDTILTLTLAIIIIVLFISIYFRKKFVSLIILLPVAFGAAFSLAIIYLIKGSVSTIAIGAGSIVLGIAINYSLHVFSHFRHKGNVKTVLKDLSNPMTLGSFTTVGAFLGLLFVKSDTLRDFGLFSALSLVGAIIFSLVVLPHMLGKDKTEEDQPYHPKETFIDRISEYRIKRHTGYFAFIIFILTIFFFFFSQKVGFDGDMMKLNFESKKIKNAENNLNKISDISVKSMYLVSTGKTLDEALENGEKIQNDLQKLKKQHVITNFANISFLFPSESLQKKRIASWTRYWTNEKKIKLLHSLTVVGKEYHFSDQAFDGFDQWLHSDFKPMAAEQSDKIHRLFLDNWITQTPTQSLVVTMLKISQENKKIIHKAFEKNPDIIVFDKSFLTTQFVDVINKDFNLIFYITTFLVFFTLLISYGRIELAVIVFIPMLVTWFWIMGIMYLLGMNFNIVNIIISTFIFGLGDDYAIFVMDGLLQEYKTGKKNLSSYKTAIFLSAFTTIIGVGVLIFARHPALKSIALISIIGMFSVVFISYTFEPIMFRWLIYKKTRRRSVPITWFWIIYTPLFYAFYYLNCLGTLLFGLTVLKVLPLKRKYRNLLFRNAMMIASRLTIYVMFLVKKRFINWNKDTFAKPAVIICNHQSIIDIPLSMMFTPKMIILTTDWVWNNAFIGKIARMADFYPVSSGLDALLPQLQAKVNEGYSIFVFPEGHRSQDLKIHRFHKGAFYIAEKLQLDILPMVMHGTGDYVSKNELFGKKSRITVKFLDRITPSDQRFGKDYSERTKKIKEYFKNEFEEIRETYNTPEYFKNRLLKNYIYKGPVLEWYVRVKLKLENNYNSYLEYIPKTGNIVDLGCGYGYFTFLLAFLSENRKITGVDYDADKIALASHCQCKNSNTQFVCCDVMAYGFEPADAFILNDVLHYLPEKDQEKLLRICIKNLNAGGSIIIRDADSELSERHRGTRFTEFFSTKTGFNKTVDKHLHFTPGSLIENIASEYALKTQRIDNSKLTSNMLYIIKKPMQL